MRSERILRISVAVVFILLEIAAISVLRSSSSIQDEWMNKASMNVVSFLWSGAEKVRCYFSLDEQNRDLQAENERLLAELQKYRDGIVSAAEVAASNQVECGNFTRIPARVVKLGRNTSHNYIILDKGSEDGVLPNSGIVSAKGVVGIVTAVSRHHSFGLTLINSHIKIGAKVGRNGVAAPMVWDGIHVDRARVTDLPPQFSAAPTDTVYTSGYSLMFPSGIALGTPGSSRMVDGSTLSLDVHLFQNYKALGYVTVLVNPTASEIEFLENKEVQQ